MIDFDYVKEPGFWNSVFEPLLIAWDIFAKSLDNGDFEGVLKDGEF